MISQSTLVKLSPWPASAGGVRQYHAMVKPIGSICNLDCTYCCYLRRKELLGSSTKPQISDEILETHIHQYIEGQGSEPKMDRSVATQKPDSRTLPGILHFERRNRLSTPVIFMAILFAMLGLYQTAQAQQADSKQQAAAAEAPAEKGKPATGTGDLEKAVQNPVASLISVPLQNNTNFAISPFGRTQNVLNIQPVIPMNVSKNWMVISRIIQPIVWQPYANQNTGGQYGLGDMVPTFFLSPRKPGKLIWGVGPALTIPTATNTILGQGKLSLGPSAVALAQPGPWTLGALVNNVWSVAGSGSRPAVNQMLLQYFVTRQLKKGWYVTSSPILTANWEASNGNRWVVPFGGGIGRVMKLGFQPVNVTAQFYGNAVRPAGGSSWSMRLQIMFLYPR
ncbi:MAG: neuromedin U [Acidobacteriota bacterium]